MFMSGRKSLGLMSIIIVLTMVLQSCASSPQRNATPEELIDQATVPGGNFARMWGDQLPPDLDSRLALLRQQLSSNGDENVFTRPHYYLSISGGGANGAFGAGLLKGWSESGTRPEMTY